MSKIKVMSENMANMIAAGEVIEKCASVVKELVENAIDANAHLIKINLENGGINKIEVVDDGIGMDKDDALLAFSRHATSKIYKEDDLFFIETLGFRGEALASIASVSEVEMETCNGMDSTYIHIKGGKLLESSHGNGRVGTKITVKNLFFNTPARLKYLKTETTELNNCLQFIERLALSKPDISFQLANNEKVLFKTSGSNNLLKTIHEIYGLNVSQNMLEIKAFNDDFLISGYIGKPSILRKNRLGMHTIVNGRIVRNLDLNKAINDAYNTYKHEGFYPIVVINITVDPTMVDVNIHPTKQDIKMSKIDVLTTFIYKTIKDTLYQNLLIPNAIKENDKKEEINFLKNIEQKHKENSSLKSNYPFNKEPVFNDITNAESLLIKDIPVELEQQQLNIGYEEVVDTNLEFRKLKLYPVGQVHRTYIIATDEENMYIIDQHAAHERVNYENICKKIKDKEVSTTKLLVPLTIELSISDFTIFQERKSTLEELGFTIEDFGVNTIIIKEHPTWLKSNHEDENIKSIIDLVITNEKKFAKDKFLDSMAKMVSCKMSVKANEDLSFTEMEHLLNDLTKCDNPYNCCHGRPSIMKYSKYELEKMFRRVL